MIKLILLLLLVGCRPLFADTVNNGQNVLSGVATPDATVLINDQFRQNIGRITASELSIDTLNGLFSNNVLQVRYGGTGQDFSSVVQNSIPYFSSTGTLGTIGIGTTGYFLQSQGGTNPPAYALPNTGTKLVSVTTITTSTNTGNITIDNTKNYQIIVDMGTFGGQPNTISVLINNDTGADYGSAAANGLTSIVAGTGLDDTGTAGTAIDNFMNFQIFRQGTQGVKYVVIDGYLTGEVAATGLHTRSAFTGRWGATATAASFRVTATNTWTGKVYLYEILQS